ncbi:alpha-1,6-mannosylglycoprotein 6-beta-N-acetylglucosaminyltransferase B-like [Aplochiton taeniatus]
MRVALRPRSGCLVMCLCLSVVTLLLQSLLVPPQITRDQPTGRSPKEHGPRGGASVHRLALRLEALSSQVQQLTRERHPPQNTGEDLTQFLHGLRQDQEGVVRSMQEELKRLAQKLDHLAHHPAPNRPKHRSMDGLLQECEVPVDPRYPACAQKVEFLLARWQSDPCYAFYGVNGTTCSVLTYLREMEGFCPPRPGRNHSSPPWLQQLHSHTEKAEVRTTLHPLVNDISSIKGPAVTFIRTRLLRLSEQWAQAGRRRKENTKATASPLLRVLLYPGVLGGPGGQRFASMVERGGPLGELVQWADLSACLFTLGHNVTLTTSQNHLHRLIGAAPGQGSCPIQRPLPFDLLYTDYHGLSSLKGAMGLAFQHYQCRFRILDSFGTEPVFNLGSYSRSHGYSTLWGSWGLQPLQYMTMFPHTPDNSFLGFVTEEVVREEEEEEEPRTHSKENLAVVYGKQDYMWQGTEGYLEVIGAELETHATVYHAAGRPAQLPSSVINHGLLTQEHFLQLLRRAKVFVGLGFPYEGPAPLEAIALGCVFLQPRFSPPLSGLNSDFYKGKPTTRQVSSQHPYAEDFIGKPYVWTVDMANSTDVREAVRAILHTQVKPFTPRESTCGGMLERVHAYITHQNFCSMSFPTWPPEGVLRVHLGPLGQSCVGVCRRSSLVCEPALFHHLNSPATFTRLGLGCSSTEQEVNPLYPAYSPWGRRCGLQQEPLLFSCAGADPAHRRLCPCRVYLPGQVALCPGCL